MDISEIRKKAKKKKKKEKVEEKKEEILEEISPEIIATPENNDDTKSDLDKDLEKAAKIFSEDTEDTQPKEDSPVEEDNNDKMSDESILKVAGETLLSRAFLNTDIVSEKNVVEFLGIKIDNEDYGINIENIFEITKIKDITKVPLTPDYVLGIISLRGKILTLISLRKKFGLEDIEPSPTNRIIVVSGEDNEEIAILVDEVTQVYRIPENNIEPHPTISQSQTTENFVKGIAKGENLFLLILDPDKITKVDINEN